MRLYEYRQINEIDQIFENFSSESDEPKEAFDSDEKKYLSTLGFKHESKGVMMMAIENDVNVVFKTIKTSTQYVVTRHINDNVKKWYFPKPVKGVNLEGLSSLMQSSGVFWGGDSEVIVSTKTPVTLI